MGRKIEESEIDRVVAAYKTDASVTRIARTLGLDRGTIRIHLRKAGILELKRVNWEDMSEETKDAIVNGYKENTASIRSVSDDLGISTHLVNKTLIKRGAVSFSRETGCINAEVLWEILEK